MPDNPIKLELITLFIIYGIKMIFISIGKKAFKGIPKTAKVKVPKKNCHPIKSFLTKQD